MPHTRAGKTQRLASQAFKTRPQREVLALDLLHRQLPYRVLRGRTMGIAWREEVSGSGRWVESNRWAIAQNTAASQSARTPRSNSGIPGALGGQSAVSRAVAERSRHRPRVVIQPGGEESADEPDRHDEREQYGRHEEE